jgi:hypothetical protein
MLLAVVLLGGLVGQGDSTGCSARELQYKALLRPGLQEARARIIIDSLGFIPTMHRMVLQGAQDSLRASNEFISNRACSSTRGRLANGLSLVLHLDGSRRVASVTFAPFFRGP